MAATPRRESRPQMIVDLVVEAKLITKCGVENSECGVNTKRDYFLPSFPHAALRISIDPSAAHYAVVVIKHNRLARSDAVARLVEANVQPGIWQQLGCCCGGRTVVADFGRAAKLARWWID